MADRDRHCLHRHAGRCDRLCRAAGQGLRRVRRALRAGAELGRLGRDKAALRIDGALCPSTFSEEPGPAARQLRLCGRPPGRFCRPGQRGDPEGDRPPRGPARRAGEAGSGGVNRLCPWPARRSLPEGKLPSEGSRLAGRRAELIGVARRGSGRSDRSRTVGAGIRQRRAPGSARRRRPLHSGLFAASVAELRHR